MLCKRRDITRNYAKYCKSIKSICIIRMNISVNKCISKKKKSKHIRLSLFPLHDLTNFKSFQKAFYEPDKLTVSNE